MQRVGYRKTKRKRVQRSSRNRLRLGQPESLEERLMLARDVLLAEPATGSILRFDGATGAAPGAFVSSGLGGLVEPQDPTFGPDGNLYVLSNAASANAQILRYAGDDGAFLGTFVDTGVGGFAGGSAIEFGLDGNLYVATGSDAGVLRYSGSDGSFLGVAATVDSGRRAVGRTLSAYTTDDLAGDSLTIHYTVYNLTADFVTEVALETTLEPGVTFASASIAPNVAGATLAWELGRLGPLETASVDVSVTLDAATPLTLDAGAAADGLVNFSTVVADAALPATLRTDPIDRALLAATPDANADDLFVRAKAAELNQDAAEIFAFMTQEVGYESYIGSLRGARGTLWSGAGNALDQSSLLVALLRASGVPARYVAGTLADPLAEQLILSMFAEPLRVTGFIPNGAELSDPAHDPQLLAETREHTWVEFDTGAGFQDADPTFVDAALGDTFAAQASIFTEVDDALRHKVTLQVDRELANTAGSLFGGVTLDVATVLDVTFNAVDLVGKPLSIGQFVDQKSLGSPVFTSITNVYSPYIAVGDFARPFCEFSNRCGGFAKPPRKRRPCHSRGQRVERRVLLSVRPRSCGPRRNKALAVCLSVPRTWD